MKDFLGKYLGKYSGSAYLELRGETLTVRDIVINDTTDCEEEYERKGVGIRAIGKREIFKPSTLPCLEKDAKKVISLAQKGAKRMRLKEISPVKTHERTSFFLPSIEETHRMLADFHRNLRVPHASVGIHYREVTGKKYIMTSESTDIEKDVTFWSLTTNVQSSVRGRTVMICEESGSKTQKPRFSELQKRLLGRFQTLLEGVKPRCGTFPCVLGPIVAGSVIHEAVGHNCEADFAHDGLYWMKDQKIASEVVTVRDDGRYPRGIGTEKYDDEGVPTREVELIKSGILNAFLTDRIHAGKMNLPLTGSSRGASFEAKPLIRMRNIALETGSATLDELLEGIRYGFLCCSPLYSRVENFEFYVGIQECYEIRNAEISKPVILDHIEGETFSFLKNIENIGKNCERADFQCEKEQRIYVSQIAPSIRVKKGGVRFL
jgi:predicted Zn-dependent protease